VLTSASRRVHIWRVSRRCYRRRLATVRVARSDEPLSARIRPSYSMDDGTNGKENKYSVEKTSVLVVTSEPGISRLSQLQCRARCDDTFL